jgi:hypothetical protein
MMNSKSHLLTPAAAFVLLSLAAACGGSSSSGGGGSGGAVCAPAACVGLGEAGSYVILAKSGISTTGTTAITGNLGVSPAAASAITGFGLIADSTNVFSTSSLVNGKVYAANYTAPTPSNLTTAVGDMQLAYTDAAGRTPGAGKIDLLAGDINTATTLVPGVYKWNTNLLVEADVTLNGSSTDVWIFQVAGTLTVSSGKKIILAGGALPQNVFWQASGAVTLNTTVQFKGVVLTQTAATLDTGASINGRLLAQTAVSLDASTVSQP